MDPLTILGIAGNVSHIVNIIAKTINYLREVHRRWTNADLSIVILISQLTALRAALGKISEWIQSDLAAVPQHHQLVMDLEQTVSCCQMLVRTMDSYILSLDLKEDGVLEKTTRIRAAFHEETCKDFQVFIQRQTSALNLLLSACNCKTSSEQKALLEKSVNRTIFKRIQDDSSSLIVLRDNDSSYTNVTQSSITSSRMSKVFPFDTELMGSSVYQRAVRCLFKQTRSYRPAHGTSKGVSESHPRKRQRQTSTSTDIFSTLKRSGVEVKCKIQIAMLGDFGNRTDSFPVFLKMLHLASSPGKVQNHKDEIVTALLNCIHALLHEFEGERQPCKQSSIDIFRQQTAESPKISPELASAISDIWQSFSHFSNSDLASSLSLPIYFLDNIPRIATPNYTPLPSDLAHLPTPPSIQRIKIRSLSGGLNYSFLQPGETLQSNQEICLRELQHVDAILFAIDACSYDQPITHKDDNGEAATPASTALDKSKRLFKAIVNSPHLRGKPTILLFLNADVLRTKLQPPLQYSDSSSASSDRHDASAAAAAAAARYAEASADLSAQFRRLAQESVHPDKRDVIAHFVGVDQRDADEGIEGADVRLLRFIESAVNEMIIWENIRNVLKTL